LCTRILQLHKYGISRGYPYWSLRVKCSVSALYRLLIRVHIYILERALPIVICGYVQHIDVH
jgi:hypothetical protein